MHHLKIRISVFICSILMTAFGIDLITVASLGTSPISSVPLVISLYTPWTFGQLTFALNMAFIVLQMALLRRQFRPVELLQIAINFVFSAAIDFFMHVMADLVDPLWRPGDSDRPWRRYPGIGHARRALRQFLQPSRLFHRTPGPSVLG